MQREKGKAKVGSAEAVPLAQNRLPQQRPGLACCYLALLSNRTFNSAPGGERERSVPDDISCL